jgi:AcrR family transcriptional regulator
MGINPPSLYAAFGDKETLYLEALEYYVNGAACRKALLDSAPSAREAVEALLTRSATTLPELGMGGCMLVTSAVNASSPKVRKAMTACRASVEAGLRRRIERGIREGELPLGTDAAGLAKFYETIIQGMSTQIPDGASSKVLRGIVATAMRAWPEKKPARRKAA